MNELLFVGRKEKVEKYTFNRGISTIFFENLGLISTIFYRSENV